MRPRALLAVFALFAASGCGGPDDPPAPTDKPKLTLEVRADKTAVDLRIDSPVTLSALQVVLVFDPAQVGVGAVSQGPDGPRISKVFDDGARVPGRLTIGLADLNRNPLPRSGALVRIPLTAVQAGAELGLSDAVAIDLFGEKVEVDLEGAVVP